MTQATKNRKLATLHRKLTGNFLEGYKRCPGCPGKKCDKGKIFGGYCGGFPVEPEPEPTFTPAETVSAPEDAAYTMVAVDFSSIEERLAAYHKVSGPHSGGYVTGRMAAANPNPLYNWPPHHGRPDHIDREGRMREFHGMYGGTVTGRITGTDTHVHEIPPARAEEVARLRRIIAERGVRMPTAESLLEDYDAARARERVPGLADIAERWGVAMREYTTRPITITLDSASMLEDMPTHEAAPEPSTGEAVVAGRKPRRITPPQED